MTALLDEVREAPIRGGEEWGGTAVIISVEARDALVELADKVHRYVRWVVMQYGFSDEEKHDLKEINDILERLRG